MKTMRHLILNLEAPLMAFGGETIDNLGVIRPFPAVSMLTGLFANALGWRRVERERHQALQDRIVFAARIDREPATGIRMTDYQTVKLYEDDQGWTTRGDPEGRQKSPSYRREGSSGRRALTWQRYRDYYADMRVTVALRLQSAEDDDAPTLDELSAALREPRRPLFIGRKPCLPSAPLFGGFSDGDTALAALLAWPLADDVTDGEPIRLQWPVNDGQTDDRVRVSRPDFMLTDQRNWVSGLHGGGRWVGEGNIDRGKLQKKKDESP